MVDKNHMQYITQYCAMLLQLNRETLPISIIINLIYTSRSITERGTIKTGRDNVAL